MQLVSGRTLKTSYLETLSQFLCSKAPYSTPGSILQVEVGEEEREGNEVFVEISGRMARKIWMAAFSDIEDKPMRGHFKQPLT